MTIPSFTVVALADLDGTPAGTDITSQLDGGDCQVRLNEEGSGGVLVPHGETITPDPVGKAIVVAIDGTVVFTFVVEGRRDVEVDPREEAGMVTEYYGRGLGSLLDRIRWAPTRGEGRSPYGERRSFTVGSPEFDPTGWVVGNTYGTLLDSTAFWDEKPDAYPDFVNSERIGPLEGDDFSAPQGYWRFVDGFVLDEDSNLIAFAAADNAMHFLVEGFRFATIDAGGDTTAGFTTAKRIPLGYFNTGDVRVAGIVVNTTPDGADPGPGEGTEVGGNPSFALAGIWKVGPDGELLEQMWGTSATTLVESYSDPPPGMTDLEVIEVGVAEAVALGLSPAITVVGHGTFEERESITVPVGGSLLAHLRDRADGGWIDWWFNPVDLELHVWPSGERGSASGVTYSTANGNLLRLQATQLDVGTTGLWVGWQGPPAFVGTGERVGFYNTGATTVGEAKELAEAILARDPQPEQVTVDIAPTTGDVPGVDVLDGDTVTAGSYEDERVIGWSLSWPDQHEDVAFDLELKDRIRGEDERLKLMLQRAAPGQMGGDAPAAPAFIAPLPDTKGQQQELTWNIEKPDDEEYVLGEAPSDRLASSSINIYGGRLSLKALTSGTFTLEYKIDGATVITASITTSTPNLSVKVPTDDFDTHWVAAGSTRTTIEITSVGVGAGGASFEALGV